jgi:hypothetical protein
MTIWPTVSVSRTDSAKLVQGIKDALYVWRATAETSKLTLAAGMLLCINCEQWRMFFRMQIRTERKTWNRPQLINYDDAQTDSSV